MQHLALSEPDFEVRERELAEQRPALGQVGVDLGGSQRELPRSMLAKACGQYTGWGPGLADYDNDGLLDIFVANGHAHREFSEEDVMMRNTGKLRFDDVAQKSGQYFHEKYVGRGATYADYFTPSTMSSCHTRPKRLKSLT